MSERRFRLRASVEPVVAGDGTLYLSRAGDDDLVVRGASAEDRALVALLAQGEPTVAELAAQLALPAAVVRSKLDDLMTAAVATTAPASAALDPEDAERYDRQLPYLGEFGDERELQRRLSTARVTVIGCGGLGTWALAALAGAGVRRLRVVDHDTVELSNLNRQVLFSRADIGAPKVQAAAAWLRAFDPRSEVEPLRRMVDGPEAADAVVVGSDAVVLVADQPAYALAHWVNAASLRHGVPFITAGQLPPLLKIGPLHAPGHSACFTCLEHALRVTSADYDAYTEHTRTAPVRGATLGPASGIVGTMLAMEILHLLIGVTPASAGAALLYDLRTLTMRREPVARDPECPDCGRR
ncbi:MAG TPA: TOMM precursor leader peptide-binding protein [Solirubrobacter sp.]